MIDHKLVTLLTIIKTGSFTKAADILNLTQPAVSHQVRLLENEYNIRIFYPRTRKINLTPEGELLVKYAKKQQNAYKNFLEELQSYKNGGRLFKIGLTPTAEDNIVPDVIARYCTAHKDTRISIISDTIKKIHTKLTARALDFAIIEGSISDSELESRLLSIDHLCLIVSPEHPVASLKSATIDDIMQLPLIMRPRSAGTRQLFEAYLNIHNEKLKHFNIMMEIDNVSTLKALVMSNLGASVVAHSSCIAESLRGQLKIIPISDSVLNREINIVYHHDFSHPKIIDELCQLYEDTKQMEYISASRAALS